MSKPPDSTVAKTVTGFNDIAAQRGDGLHPLLLQALTRFGSVSGPPPKLAQNDDTVVHADFSKTDTSRARSGTALR